MDLKANQSLEWYYKKLMDLHQQSQEKKPQQEMSTVEETSSGQENAPRLVSPQSSQALQRIMGHELQRDHSLWASAGGEGFAPGQAGSSQPVLTESLRKALESDLERHLLRARDQTSPKQWGNMPLGIRSALEAMADQRQPRIDWGRTLSLFAFSGYRTTITATKHRMSKRFNTFPGIRIKREQRIAVVIDTSGSITAQALQLFFGEIHGIWRTGAEVVVIEADTVVQQIYSYRGKPPKAFKGGGGTSFDPALQWVGQSRNGRFDACIYLTDGCAPEPTVSACCPLLWVITPGGITGKHLHPGRVVCMP